jgi:hypothetical protein
MNRSAILVCATALAFALVGCAPNAGRTFGSSYPSYDPLLPLQARASGPMQVSLVGSPFADADMLAALNAGPNMHGLTFGPVAGPARPGYGIAFNFTTNVSNPCNNDGSETTPLDAGTSAIRVVAAFCRSGSLLSRTNGMAPRPIRADDLEFRRFMSALVIELMPASKPWGVENGDCPDRPNC